jgi:hypothetical protein
MCVSLFIAIVLHKCEIAHNTQDVFQTLIALHCQDSASPPGLPTPSSVDLRPVERWELNDAEALAAQWGFEDLDTVNEGGHSVLHFAIERLRLSAIDDEEARQDLILLARAVPLEVVHLSTRADSRPASSMPIHMIASGADHLATRVAVAQLLIERRASVNSLTGQGATPLMKAAGTAAFDMVQFLIECRSDINLENYRGQTACDMASGSNKRVS